MNVFDPEEQEQAQLAYETYKEKYPDLPAWKTLSLFDRGMYAAMARQSTGLEHVVTLLNRTAKTTEMLARVVHRLLPHQHAPEEETPKGDKPSR